MIKNIKGFFEVFQEVNYVLDEKQKRQSILLVVLILFSSLMELLGVGAVVPFIQAILMPEQLLDNSFIKFVWDKSGWTDYTLLILLMGLVLIAIYLFKNIFIIIVSYVRLSYTARWQKDISIRMLKSYMTRPYTYFLNTNSSEISWGCSAGVDYFNSTVNQFFVLATESITVLIISLYLIYTDVFTAICAFLMISVIFVLIMAVLKPRVKESGIYYSRAVVEKQKIVTQISQGIKDILVMQRKENFVLGFRNAAEKLRINIRRYNIISMLPDRITEGICVSGIIAIVIVRLLLGEESKVEFVPQLAAFAMASFKILPSVGKISNSLNTIVFSRPGEHNLYTNFVEAERIERERDKRSNREDSDSADGEPIELSDDFEVCMENVTWQYNPNQKLVLDELSLKFRKGESIGLIGTSGGGKTTTIDVLLGLLEPQRGTVTVNNQSIFEIPYTWAHMVGYVPQSVFLTDDTVRENVIFGAQNVSDDDIWEALERAQLKDFILSLPKQLDTVVGERGVRFSGGQRQRIAIARALLNKPQILVLDEATAALDNETENAVMEAVETLQGTITLVIVAHRLTTIRNCDRVYEVKDGKAFEADSSAFK